MGATLLLFCCFAFYAFPSVKGQLVRLEGGTVASEGRVEVQRLGSGSWVTVCDTNWDLNDADTVCRQLFNGFAISIVAGAHFGQGSGSTWVGADCTGAENSIALCPEASGGSCSHTQDAGVVCSTEARADGSLRLADSGSTPYGGRLELYDSGSWGTVCSDFWEQIDSGIACRQLGFPGFVDYMATYPPGASNQRILLDNVKCFGSEQRLVRCSHKGIGEHNCNHTSDVGIQCSRVGNSTMNYRLIGGRDHREGRVEVLRDEVWSSLCDATWDISDADVLCWDLGMEYAVAAGIGSAFGPGDGPVWSVYMNCVGRESSLSNCAQSTGSSCSNLQEASVICGGSTLVQGALRFNEGGSTRYGGRLEVYVSSRWGSVCDDDWGEPDAAVACSQLGFEFVANSKTDPPPGRQSQPIWLDGVACGGSETQLVNCAHNGLGINNCEHAEDVGIVCATEGVNNVIAIAAAAGGVGFLLLCICFCLCCVFCSYCCCKGRHRSKRRQAEERDQQRRHPSTLAPSRASVRMSKTEEMASSYPVLLPSDASPGEPPPYPGLSQAVNYA